MPGKKKIEPPKEDELQPGDVTKYDEDDDPESNVGEEVKD